MTFRFLIAFSAILVLANGANIGRGDQDGVVVVQSGGPVVVVSPGAQPQRPSQNRFPHPVPVRGPHRRQPPVSHSRPVTVVVPVPVPVAPNRHSHREPVGPGHSHRHQNRNHNQRPF